MSYMNVISYYDDMLNNDMKLYENVMMNNDIKLYENDDDAMLTGKMIYECDIIMVWWYAE